MNERALPPRATAILLALVSCLAVFRLGTVPLLGPDEPRYARVAVEMHRASEWTTPTLAGEPWLEKPPLYYWLAGAAYAVLGETESAARLPSAMALVLLVGATALSGARLFGSAAGLHAGFVAGTAVLPFVYGRAASMDMLLAACVTLAIGLAGLRLLGIAGPPAFVAAAAAAGAATLAKGPLGLLLPLLVIGAYLALTREWRFLREMLSPWSIGAFLIVAAPWYVAISLDQGRHFLDVFILDHNVQRFTSTVHNHPGPFLYYVPVLLVGFFPWSGLLVPALFRFSPHRSRASLFVLSWAAVPLVFFSLAGSKLPGYILPCVPPLALLMGRAADRLIHEAPTPERLLSGRVVALVGLALAAALAFIPALLHYKLREPLWTSTIPLVFWSVILAFFVSRRIGVDPAGALRLLRIGAAGLLLLVMVVAPPVVSRHETGRDFWKAAMGREVLAWGAWRTAWMAGYFYNDAKVREVSSLPEVLSAMERGPILVLAGPAETRRLESMAAGPRSAPDPRVPGTAVAAGGPAGALEVHVLVRGVRQNALLRVERAASESGRDALHHADDGAAPSRK